MSVFDFIEYLESSGILKEKVTKKLRKQIKASPKSISAKSLAKLLIKKEVLNREQAVMALKEYGRKSGIMQGLEILPDESVDEPDVMEAVPAMQTVTKEEAYGADPFAVAEQDARDEAAGVSKGRRGKRKNYTSNRWDSPLMLVGGGALLLLLFMGAGLYLYLTKGTADEAYQMADEDYKNQSYLLAIGKFEKFLDDYPDNDKASSVKVRIALGKIWSAVERKNWESALNHVKTELPIVINEEAFDDARPELSSLLPNIMQGFADSADASENSAEAESQLALAAEALSQIQEQPYLGTRYRKEMQPRLDKIDGVVKSVERRINREKELAKRIAEMRDALSKEETGQAYQIRRELLDLYPGLEDNADLQAVVVEITQKERERVGTVAELPQPETSDEKSPAEIQIVVASRKGKTAESLEGNVLFVLAKGSVYGIDAATGKPLWRRFIGFETSAQPVATSQEVGRDAIVVDSRKNELLRLEGTTGKLIWRLACPNLLSTPTISDDRIIVSCSDGTQGRLLHVDAASGAVSQALSFPMELVSSALATDDGRIFQPGSHSSMFVLNDELQCEDVLYIGHNRKTVVVPPVSVLGHVIVAENPAPNFALLHVFGPDPQNDGKLRQAMPPVRLQGRVIVPMTSFGRRLLVATDRGAVQVFDIDARADIPLKESIQGLSATDDLDAPFYVFYTKNRLWVGSDQFGAFDLQTSRGTFSQRRISHKGDLFLGPMQQIGNVLFHLRRQRKQLGATLTATSIANGSTDGQTIWQTTLAVPPAGDVFVDGEKKALNIMTSNAELFSLGRQELKMNSVDSPASFVARTDLPALTSSVDIGSGRRAFVGEGKTNVCVTYDPKAVVPLQAVALSIGGDSPSTMPIEFGGNLIVPTDSGTVYLIDPLSGQPAAHEFQPALQSDDRIEWTRPVVAPDGEHVILSDGQQRFYRVGLQPKPQLHLTVAQQVESDSQTFGRLAICGSAIYASQHGLGADEIIALDASSLKSADASWSLDGKLALGPIRVADVVIVSSQANELLCLDADKKERWKSELPYGPLSGPPIAIGDTLIFCSIQGVVWQVDSQTGEQKSKMDLGEPLGTGAVRFGSRLIVLGSDSTLHVLSVPAG